MSGITVLPGKDDIIVEDDDLNIQYFPTDKWRLAFNDNLSEGRARFTREYLAGFTYTFIGTHVWYYGDTNLDHGSFAVSIDKQRYADSSSSSPQEEKGMLLFHAELEFGTHTITVICLQENLVTVLDWLVYRPFHDNSSSQTSTVTSIASSSPVTLGAQTSSTSTSDSPAVADQPTGSVSPSPTAASSSSKHSSAIAIAVPITVTLVLLVAVALVLLIHSRRGKRKLRPKTPTWQWVGPDEQQRSDGINPFPVHPQPSASTSHTTWRERKRALLGLIGESNAVDSEKEAT